LALFYAVGKLGPEMKINFHHQTKPDQNSTSPPTTLLMPDGMGKDLQIGGYGAERGKGHHQSSHRYHSAKDFPTHHPHEPNKVGAILSWFGWQATTAP
jgi:hypothetical protein